MGQIGNGETCKTNDYEEIISHIKVKFATRGNGDRYIFRLHRCEKTSYSISKDKFKNEVNIGSGFNITGISQEGKMAFAFSNQIDMGSVSKVYANLMQIMETGTGLDSNDFSSGRDNEEVFVQSVIYPYTKSSKEEIGDKLNDIYTDLQTRFSEVKNLNLKYIEWLEEWWIIAEGTEVIRTRIPHSCLMVWGQVSGQKVKSEVGKSGEKVITNAQVIKYLYWELEEKVAWLNESLRENIVLSGSYPLLIDYSVAKSFAHEILGHSVESNLTQTVHPWREVDLANPQVNVIDEPIAGEFGYTPISSNGVSRKACYIVKAGVLSDELTDIFTSHNKSLIGAARAESYAHFPKPRMCNTRLEVSKQISSNLTKESSLDDIHKFLQTLGIFEKHQKVVVCRGFQSGECSFKHEQFSITVQNAFILTRDKIMFAGPAQILGNCRAALKSIDWSVGPVVTDVIGICKKDGQSILTAGGGNLFTFLNQIEGVKIDNELFKQD